MQADSEDVNAMPTLTSTEAARMPPVAVGCRFADVEWLAAIVKLTEDGQSLRVTRATCYTNSSRTGTPPSVIGTGRLPS
jgi:hypothetical protein